ncbi:hypothetical protein [Methylobacterium sp. WL7]|nr:hypothetical protein [Methylobacterium sp. WL7]
MTAILMAPIACSTAVLSLALLGVRPLGIVPAMVAVVGGCWWIA